MHTCQMLRSLMTAGDRCLNGKNSNQVWGLQLLKHWGFTWWSGFHRWNQRRMTSYLWKQKSNWKNKWTSKHSSTTTEKQETLSSSWQPDQSEELCECKQTEMYSSWKMARNNCLLMEQNWHLSRKLELMETLQSLQAKTMKNMWRRFKTKSTAIW